MKTLFILISLFFAVSLSARQRDSRVREYLPPARIVWQQESQLIQGANHLLLSGNGQSNLVNHNICKLSSTDRQHPAKIPCFSQNTTSCFSNCLMVARAKSSVPGIS